MNWNSESIALTLVTLLAISEVIALIPGVKANSIFQAIVNILKTFVKK